jgi:hypothetical protein
MANHSQDGNLRIVYDKYGLVVLIVMQDIEECEELTYEYSEAFNVPSGPAMLYEDNLSSWISPVHDQTPLAPSATDLIVGQPKEQNAHVSSSVVTDVHSHRAVERIDSQSTAEQYASMLRKDMFDDLTGGKSMLPSQMLVAAQSRNKLWLDRNIFAVAFKTLRSQSRIRIIAHEGSEFVTMDNTGSC